MFNWLIKLLGGYTASEQSKAAEDIGNYYRQQISYLNKQLHETQKNDYRDSNGRFAKRPEGK